MAEGLVKECKQESRLIGMDQKDETTSNDPLKLLCKDLSSRGITYRALAMAVQANGWSENSLKQFVNRDGSSRKNVKTRALAKAAIKEAERIIDSGKSDDQFIRKVEAVSHQFQIEDNKSNFEREKPHSLSSFSIVKNKSKLIFLPEKFAFARFGRTNQDTESGQPKQVITTLVNTRSEESGYIFSMKIQGAGGRRRIVVGNVLSTHMNLYFSGIAYKVISPISEDDFYQIDPFNNEDVESVVSKNELGIEMFCISNSAVSDPISPACYVGLDGYGNPISGIGVVIIRDFFEKHGILEHVFSTVNCAENTSLTKVLEMFNGVTCIPSNIA